MMGKGGEKGRQGCSWWIQTVLSLGVLAMADFCPLVALQELCHPQCLWQGPESSRDHPQSPELRPPPPHCRNGGTTLPWLGGESPVSPAQLGSVPTMAGQCPHGKPVPAGLSPLSPHHFYTGAGGSRTSCHRGVGQQQLGSFREPGLSPAHTGAFWETKPFLYRLQRAGKCELGHQGKGNLFLPPLSTLSPAQVTPWLPHPSVSVTS